jgi:hypothetical protein
MANWEVANRGSTQASFLKELAQYRKDPQWELFCESPEWPIYVYEHKETGQLQYVGDALGIQLLNAIVEREHLTDDVKPAALPFRSKRRSKGFGE